MPELPEVETIRRDLEKEIVGRRIKTVEVTGRRSVRRHGSPQELVDQLEGRTVTGVRRRGKFLLIDLDSRDVLVVHLGMSGQLLRATSAREPLPRHTHVVLSFATGGQLRFVDPRTFGELFVAGADAAADDVPELAHLGFDPLEDLMSWEAFGRRLAGHHTPIKALLMDQRFVAGIGNMYADEILFAAGLRYDRPADSLSSQEVRRLKRAIVETLTEAVKHRGSSLADEQYRDVFGDTGAYQGLHQVYDRAGQPCRRCHRPIVRVKAAGRSTYFCDHCQV
jgi:formamidopyrimidine-DNA glycosylase